MGAALDCWSWADAGGLGMCVWRGQGLGDGTGRGVFLCPAEFKCGAVSSVAGTWQHLLTLQLFSCSKAGAIGRSREEEGGAAVEEVSRQLELGKKLEPVASAFLGKQSLLSLGFRKVLWVCRKGNLVGPLSLCSCTAEQLCWVAFVELSVTLPAAGGGRTLGQRLCCDALESKLSHSSGPGLHPRFVSPELAPLCCSFVMVHEDLSPALMEVTGGARLPPSSRRWREEGSESGRLPSHLQCF